MTDRWTRAVVLALTVASCMSLTGCKDFEPPSPGGQAACEEGATECNDHQIVTVQPPQR